MTRDQHVTTSTPCPRCGAPGGTPCRNPAGGRAQPTRPHTERRRAWQQTRHRVTPDSLRARRLALGLTQTELAGRLGTHRNTVARWEQGAETIGQPLMLGLALSALEARR